MMTAANTKRIRTIGIREQADVFTTEIDARMAIDLPPLTESGC